MTDPTRIYDDQHNNAPAVPQGWKLVPVEPTRAMWAAVNKLDDEMAAGSYDGKGCSIEQAWNCMLDFAPDAPALAATPAPAPAQEVGLTDGEPAHGAGLLEQRRELDAIEFFESTNRDSYGFKKSVRDTYVNPAVARDWKWFQLGMKHATEDES